MTQEVPTHIREWVLLKKPSTEKLTKDHFELRTVPLAEEGLEGKILVQILFISNDPAQRTWMDDGPFNARSYLPPVMHVGAKVFAGAVCKVLKVYPGVSAEYNLHSGDIVFGHYGWADYAVVDPTVGFPPLHVPQNIKAEDFPCIELTGQTAYFSFFRRAENPTADKVKTVVVNSAAGAVGSMLCQLAKKITGIERVIGICGDDEKCEIIKSQCGVDIALNYKHKDFEQKFEEATPGYIDLFFDNVGGKQLDLGVQRIAPLGKIICIGAISHYQREETSAISGGSWMQIIYQQASVLGFIITRYGGEVPQAIADLSKWVREGKIAALKTVHEVTVEEIPDTYLKLYDGNPGTGKLISKLKL